MRRMDGAAMGAKKYSMQRNGDVCISILVPVYNAEQFLPECIESALNQTYKNYEIILVDDGSTDTSGTICDQYATEHTSISVSHVKNGGQIRARELAAQQAKGDFLVFLDADDRLRNDALETIVATIQKYQCDCVIFGFSRLIDGTLISAPDDGAEEVLTNKRDIYRKCLEGRYNAIWRKAVKATAWNQNTSNKDILQIRLGEDLIQSLSVFKNSEKIAFINDALYEYRDNPNSITNTVTYDSYKKSMGVNEMVYQFLKQEQVFTEQDFDEFRQICIEKHVADIANICDLKTTISNKLHLMAKLRNTDYFCEFVNRGRVDQLSCKHRVLFLLNRWKLDYIIVLRAHLSKMGKWKAKS